METSSLQLYAYWGNDNREGPYADFYPKDIARTVARCTERIPDLMLGLVDHSGKGVGALGLKTKAMSRTRAMWWPWCYFAEDRSVHIYRCPADSITKFLRAEERLDVLMSFDPFLFSVDGKGNETVRLCTVGHEYEAKFVDTGDKAFSSSELEELGFFEDGDGKYGDLVRIVGKAYGQ